jgi:Ser/Thr protein kinase RdoA (MazF antagonist)
MSPTPPPVLARYPAAVAGLAWSPHPGGFSGAAVWRGDLAGRPAFALKAWPPGYPADRLALVHRLMADARVRAGLTFVPAVVPALSGATVVEHAGRAWDVTAWMPGAPDYRATPSDAKLAAACAAVAALHRAWAPPTPALAPCPGVLRRLAVLADFAGRTFDTPSPLVRQGLAVLPAHAAAAEAALKPWANRPLPVQPCLCDVWHDHVLFTGDAVTGLIDYGEVKPDHPAVDLARLLGDLVGDDAGAFRRGLDAYRADGGATVDTAFARLLDRTGVVCAAIHWVKELAAGTAPNGAEDRLARLLERLAGPPAC